MARSKFPKKTNNEAGSPPIESASRNLAAAGQNTADTTQPEPKTSSRRPTIVKSDTRASIVPINVDEEIRLLAYLMSERRGFEPGHETEDWLAAENEVRQRYRQQQSA
jgi:Protein of unknown function (DUF2934)